jgi:hypothetical protein
MSFISTYLYVTVYNFHNYIKTYLNSLYPCIYIGIMSYNIIGRTNKTDSKIREWKTIGVRIKIIQLANLNRQLDRLNYSILGEIHLFAKL